MYLYICDSYLNVGVVGVGVALRGEVGVRVKVKSVEPRTQLGLAQQARALPVITSHPVHVCVCVCVCMCACMNFCTHVHVYIHTLQPYTSVTT